MQVRMIAENGGHRYAIGQIVTINKIEGKVYFGKEYAYGRQWAFTDDEFEPVPSLNDELIKALQRIADWDLPDTGKFWDKERLVPASYESLYGSNGARDYIKNIAKEALEKVKKNM